MKEKENEGGRRKEIGRKEEGRRKEGESKGEGELVKSQIN